MKLLMVCPYLPCPTGGGRIRSYYLLKMLARKHSVSLLALVEDAKFETYRGRYPFEGFTHTVQVVPSSMHLHKRLRQLMYIIRGESYILNAHTVAEMQAALDALLALDQYDLVIFESVVVAGYRLPSDMKVIIDQHNIEHEIPLRTFQHETVWLRKWYNWMEYRLLKPIELELLP